MDARPADYHRAYGLVEHPFSLTPDEKYHFWSATHRRAFDVATAALERGERFVMITGDLGTGKTTFARLLLRHAARRGPASLVVNPLVRPEELLRLLIQDFGAMSPDEVRRARLAPTSRPEIEARLHEFLLGLMAAAHALVVVDEAQVLPTSVIDLAVGLAALERGDGGLVHFVLVGQSSGALQSLTERRLHDRIAARARLTPLERAECAAYIAHRLVIAGGAPDLFSASATELVYDLSGGLPRLVNLLCERALQEGVRAEARRIEPAQIEAAAAALEILRARPRRFRWFGAASPRLAG